MAQTIGDDFLDGTKSHLYSYGGSTDIIRITKFGSQCCVAEVYDSQGQFLRQSTIRTEEHTRYSRTPDNKIPELLRQKLGCLELKAKSQLPSLSEELEALAFIDTERAKDPNLKEPAGIVGESYQATIGQLAQTPRTSLESISSGSGLIDPDTKTT